MGKEKKTYGKDDTQESIDAANSVLRRSEEELINRNAAEQEEEGDKLAELRSQLEYELSVLYDLGYTMCSVSQQLRTLTEGSGLEELCHATEKAVALNSAIFASLQAQGYAIEDMTNAEGDGAGLGADIAVAAAAGAEGDGADIAVAPAAGAGGDDAGLGADIAAAAAPGAAPAAAGLGVDVVGTEADWAGSMDEGF
ncbi:MAG: hypothetical protein K0T99_03535 [Alphaproteobacteria bacterium]|nr:hypothetical protein [Alphaproteobacteria bacterium]